MAEKPRPAFPVPDAGALLAFAEQVCKEYRSKQLAITLRQLYYQGVARRFLPSHQDAYDRLGDVISAARLAGKFPLWALVDRTRYVRKGLTTRCDTKVERALQRAAEDAMRGPEKFLHRDRWFGQPVHVSVWFEKDALAGIFEDACEELGVSWFSCRGEPSHASLYSWIRSAADAHGVDNPRGWKDAEADCGACHQHTGGHNHKGMAKRSVILYFGDHDPTGVRIPRTAETTIRAFMEIARLNFPVEFRRIGITLEQARALDVPSFWAKPSSSDYRKFVEEFGSEEAYELDAIEPEMLGQMVRDAVRPYFDSALHDRLQRDLEEKRHQMRMQMRHPNWHKAATAFGEME